MSSLKKLAGQTAIYGLSSIVGRVLNYLLVPLYTRQFLPEEYGVVTELYAYVGFFVVLLTYGFETAFFRFQDKENQKSVHATALWSLLVSSVVFIGMVFLLIDPISNALDYSDHTEYIKWFALILAYDAIVSIPFAKLRSDGNAVKFATIKFINIGINIGLNLFFILICPRLLIQNPESWVNLIYDPSMGVGYIFLSHLVASAFTFILLVPEFKALGFGFNSAIWKKMMIYGLPLAIVGFAGIINEMLDRVLLKQLLPYEHEAKMAMIGIYGAVYKLSILMSLFNQAFRYAAEPFFFSQSNNKDAKLIYSKVLNYFTFLGAFIFLFILLYLDFIKYFIGPEYHSGLFVVPILLLANLFLGFQINLSIWFKVTDKTSIGAIISILGAAITIALNVLWIPKFGYEGSAWATLICYVVMVLMTYLTGQRYFPVPYKLVKIGIYILTSLLFYFGNEWLINYLDLEEQPLKYVISGVFILVYLIIGYQVNKKAIAEDFLTSR